MTDDKGCAECTDWGNGNCVSDCFEPARAPTVMTPQRPLTVSPHARATSAARPPTRGPHRPAQGDHGPTTTTTTRKA